MNRMNISIEYAHWYVQGNRIQQGCFGVASFIEKEELILFISGLQI